MPAAPYQVLDGSQSRTWDVEVVFTDSDESDRHSNSSFEIEDDMSPDDDMQPVLPQRRSRAVALPPPSPQQAGRPPPPSKRVVQRAPAALTHRPHQAPALTRGASATAVGSADRSASAFASPPPLRGPRTVTFADEAAAAALAIVPPSSPPDQFEVVLSQSDRSVAYRVDQHRDYFVAQAAAASDTSTTSGSSDAATPSTVPPVTPESAPFSLKKWIQSTWLGERFQVTDKTTLLVIIAIASVVNILALCVCGFGASIVAAPNAREVHVQNYNAAVLDFERSATISELSPLLPNFFTGAAAVLRLSGAVSATYLSFNAAAASTFAVTRSPVPVLGVTSGVTSATSVYLAASSVSINPSNSIIVISLQLTVGASATATPTLLSITVQSTVTADDRAPSTVVESTTDLGAPQYLTAVCIVVRINPLTSLPEIADQQSCYYPFGKWQRYSLTQHSKIPVEVRLEGDPYVTLQSESKGTDRFTGKSRADQNLEGGLAIAVSLAAAIPGTLVIIPALVECWSRRNRLMAARRERAWIGGGSDKRRDAIGPQVLVSRDDGPPSQKVPRTPGIRRRLQAPSRLSRD